MPCYSKIHYWISYRPCANCISWSTKKQPTISHSRAEVEYHSMATTTAELITRVTYLLNAIGLRSPRMPTLFCNNINVLYMSINLVFMYEQHILSLIVILFEKNEPQEKLPKYIYQVIGKIDVSLSLVQAWSDVTSLQLKGK